MAQPEDVAALLEGPKERRAEFAITAAMDSAVELYQRTRGITRSQAMRGLLAQGIIAARVSQEREAKLAQVTRDYEDLSHDRYGPQQDKHAE